MKKFTLLVGALSVKLCFSQNLAPEVISSSGGYGSISSQNISWTLGEPVSDTYTNQYSLTKGFHQPLYISVSSIPPENTSGTIYTYPNPAQDYLSLNFRGMEDGTYSVSVYDDQGKLLQFLTLNFDGAVETKTIDISSFSNGLYLVHVRGKNVSKLFKITKQK